MIKKGQHIIRSYMTLHYSFSGIRIQDGYLTPVDWMLSISLVANLKNKSEEIVDKDATLAYKKLYFWLDTNLPNVTMVDFGNETDMHIANVSSNIAMHCPGNPSDDLVLRLIHSKLSALAGSKISIGEMHLQGSDTSVQYTFDCVSSVSEYDLPKWSHEYCGDGIVKDAVPWWSRDDGFCFEFVKYGDGELTDEEMFGDIMDPMDELKRLLSDTGPTINIVKEPAKIIQVDKWKPRKVE